MKIHWQGAIVASLLALAAAAAGPRAAAQSSSTTVVPYKIHVDDAVLADLKDRLARARLPGELGGAGWDYGMNLGYLKELVAYWREKFDWRAQERRLNQFDQFKTSIDGLDIHFIHQRSQNRMRCRCCC